MPPTKISIWSKNHVVRSKILLIDFFWMKKRNHSLDFLYAFNTDIRIMFQELRYVVLKKSKLWIWCSINRISNKKRKFISHELGISFFSKQPASSRGRYWALFSPSTSIVLNCASMKNLKAAGKSPNDLPFADFSMPFLNSSLETSPS